MKSRLLILLALFAFVVGGYFLTANHSAPEPQATTTPEAPKVSPPISAPSPVPQEKSEAEASSAPVSHAEFQAIMASAEKSIPSRAQLQKLTTEEVHETPALIRAVGLQLGYVAEAISRNPALAADAFPFYEKCAKNEDYPTTVRALCYSDYERVGSSLHLAVDREAIPASVRELADKVKGL